MMHRMTSHTESDAEEVAAAIMLDDGSNPQHIEVDEVTNMHKAATKALAIPELLEMMLLHLDMETLLLAQGVKSQRQDVISSGTRAQKKLFFVPVQSFQAVALGMVHNDSIINVWKDGPPEQATLPNPLLHDFDIEDDLLSSGGELASTKAWFHLPTSIVRDMPACRRERSSWERMLITQPPENSIAVDMDNYSIWSAQHEEEHGESLSDAKNLETYHEYIECDGGGEFKLGRVGNEADAAMLECNKDRVPLWARTCLNPEGFMMLYCTVLKRSAKGLSFDFEMSVAINRLDCTSRRGGFQTSI